MAAYDFPDTAGKPTDGSFNYTAPDGTLYEWNGYAWEVPGGSGGSGSGGGDFDIPTQALPPQVAEDGDLWWCTDDGRLYIYYEDVDTTQWVDASPDNGGAGSGDSSDSVWERTGSTISPVNAGDDVEIGSGNITLNAADGSSTFAGQVISGDSPFSATSNEKGAALDPYGVCYVGSTGTNVLFLGRDTGAGSDNIILRADGSANFKGTLDLETTGTSQVTYRKTTSSAGTLCTWNSDVGGIKSEKMRFGCDGSANFVSQISVNGINGRQGGGGTLTANYYNFYWTGSSMQMWVDTVNLGDVNYTSDYRIKREIQTIDTDATSRVKALRPVSYKRADYGKVFKASEDTIEGFIAHEVQEVIPSGATGSKDCEHEIQSLRLDAILAVTVKALQESLTRIEALEAEVQSLKGGNS